MPASFSTWLEAVGRQVADDVDEVLAHQPLRAADQQRRRIARLVALDPFADALERANRVVARADRAGSPCCGRRRRRGVFGERWRRRRRLRPASATRCRSLLERHEVGRLGRLEVALERRRRATAPPRSRPASAGPSSAASASEAATPCRTPSSVGTLSPGSGSAAPRASSISRTVERAALAREAGRAQVGRGRRRMRERGQRADARGRVVVVARVELRMDVLPVTLEQPLDQAQAVDRAGQAAQAGAAAHQPDGDAQVARARRELHAPARARAASRAPAAGDDRVAVLLLGLAGAGVRAWPGTPGRTRGRGHRARRPRSAPAGIPS